MIEPVYVPYEYRAAKTGCGLDSRIYGISDKTEMFQNLLRTDHDSRSRYRDCPLTGCLRGWSVSPSWVKNVLFSKLSTPD
jgi:hypothetical protein